MTKVITYGTYDLLHYGHIKLLERAKQLGDYLIVGVTADDFDMSRGKINVQQSLMERIEAVRATGLADEIIVEEYEGQKIDDIKRYDVNIFTVGSDWKGHFDYLNDYCKVIYLDRTEGVSSTEIRSKNGSIRMGLVGESSILEKIERESECVNGIEISGTFSNTPEELSLNCTVFYSSFDELMCNSDAIYIISNPELHYEQIKMALKKGVHVLCESPIALSADQCNELYDLATANNCILMDAIKTAYATAYSRMLVLAKSGVIGKIISVDATCTSLKDASDIFINKGWGSFTSWGPTALLPIFDLLGSEYLNCNIISKYIDFRKRFDGFTKVDFLYDKSVASLKVGNSVKSEGELIISGEKGYIYVPAPWWKMDYFEIRYESSEKNRRYFYQLDGEGIRYMLVVFCKAINFGKNYAAVSKTLSKSISEMMNTFYKEGRMIF